MMNNNQLEKKYLDFLKEIEAAIPADRIITDPLRTFAYGTDASFYRLNPKIVVEVDNEAEVVAVTKAAQQCHTAITFRAAGTSLSGQAITDSILVRLGAERWRSHDIKEQGSLISLQPGVVGAMANIYLKPFQRKIGPDPASINSAKIGGIAANNASGMCCGVAQNSYQTLDSMRIVFADGAVLDTADSKSIDAFKISHESLLASISMLANKAKDDVALAARIKHKYRIKNTIGYCLNSLIDFKDPINILQHLLIGSEGTLGFISEITYQTVEDHPHKASALIAFDTILTACEAVKILKNQPVTAVELMDRAAIRSIENKPGVAEYLKTLPDAAAMLLVETRAESTEQLELQIKQVELGLKPFNVLKPVAFTSIEKEYMQYWKIRKGLFPAVGAIREKGTTVIIEDVGFDVERLAQAVDDLHALLKKYHYDEAIIFGHALEGNLHFVFTQDFSTQEEVTRYQAFMDDVCDMVVNKYDGSLKAEHSTGRNMAPFVEMEWGKQAYELMLEIKQLLDPKQILNPGVIFNEDALVHIKNLKVMYPVDDLIDQCIECGFCEPVCPSRSLSLTPRQRIASLREIARLNANNQPEQAKQMESLFTYQGVDTCAGDSLCSIQCPVDIDTGKMMKSIRGSNASDTTKRVASYLVKHYGTMESVTRFSLNSVHYVHSIIGSRAMSWMSNGMRRLSGGRIPLWNPYMPKGSSALKVVHTGLQNRSASQTSKVVYFPSCASKMMGAAKGDSDQESLHTVVVRLLERAGYEVILPDNIKGLCCGMPFESKGLNEQANTMLGELQDSLNVASSNGAYPIVFDTSPCAFRTRSNSPLEFFDITEFLHDHVLDRLDITPVEQTIALHTTCSGRKMGLEDKLLSIAQKCVSDVIVPEGVTCCGFAGDKGFTTPELNKSATHLLKPALPNNCNEGFSTSRTCEIGLSLHSERYYKSIVYLLDRCSTAKAL